VKIKIAAVMGTRPEAIKLAPLIRAVRNRSNEFSINLIHTGQHQEMARAAMKDFALHPDVDLDIMDHDQVPASVLSVLLDELPQVLADSPPEIVVVQGDTSSALGGAIAAHYAKIPVAHLEAGLRTGDRYQPFPEEINRRLISTLATYHFAPTESARAALLREGVSDEAILVCGNTGIDALHLLRSSASQPQLMKGRYFPRLILLTCHRRENQGAGIRSIARAVLEIVGQVADIGVVCPVHPNRAVSEDLKAILGDHPRVLLIPPVTPREMIWLLERATVVLTDSGGIQEEAPVFGTPVIVLREVTERHEGLQARVACLAGTSQQDIVKTTIGLLSDPVARASVSQAKNLYGDGHAADRVLEFLKARYSSRFLHASAKSARPT
jgi:UDP-N-acetylglucosamine 2-epimerase (non-hydrolysing)